MSSERSRQPLEDIRDNIVLARQFIGSMDFAAFASDVKTFYAVTRALEIISEASRHLDDSIKKRHSQIDWISVRDAGNIYRHSYDLVTERRIWDTAVQHLGPLESVVLAEMGTLEK